VSSFTSATTHQVEEAPVAKRLREQSFNRTVSHLDHRDAIAEHHKVRAEALLDLEQSLSRFEPSDLLAELRSAGLLWSVVARYVGVSDAAVRKWRRGGAIEPEHRRRLLRFAALSRLFTDNAVLLGQSGFAEWLDTRILDGFSATPLDLLVLRRTEAAASLQPLLDWMLDHADRERAEDLLDCYVGSGWREDAKEEQRFRIVSDATGDRILEFKD